MALPAPPIGPYSPAYYLVLDRIKNKYRIMNRRVLSASYDLHQRDGLDFWAADRVACGVNRSLRKLEQDQEREEAELMAADLAGKLALAYGLHPSHLGFAQNNTSRDFSPAAWFHSGMMWQGPPPPPMDYGSILEPFMNGHRPISGQYRFQGFNMGYATPPGNVGQQHGHSNHSTHCTRGYPGSGVLSSNGYDAPYGYDALPGSANARPDLVHSPRAASPLDPESPLSVLSHKRKSSTFRCETISDIDAPQTGSSTRSSSLLVSSSGLTATWPGIDLTTQDSSVHNVPQEDLPKEAGARDQYAYALSYSLSNESRVPAARLTSISPNDSISQQVMNSPSHGDRPLSRSAPSSAQPQHATGTHRAPSAASCFSNTRGSALSPIAKASGSHPEHEPPSGSATLCEWPGDAQSRTPPGIAHATRSVSRTPSIGSSASRKFSSVDSPVAHEYAYAGTTLETDELLTTSPEAWRTNARAKDFATVLLLASAAAGRNEDLREKLRRCERRFHLYNAAPQAGGDGHGRTYSAEERRQGRAKHFGRVKLVAPTQRGGGAQLAKELDRTVKRFESLNKPGPFRP